MLVSLSLHFGFSRDIFRVSYQPARIRDLETGFELKKKKNKQQTSVRKMQFSNKFNNATADQSRMASTMFEKDHVFHCLVITNCISYSFCLLILFP